MENKIEQTGNEQRLNTLLSAAARVSRDIASILDLPVLLNRTVDAICDEFGFYYAGIFLVDDSGENAVLRSGRGDAGRAMLEEEHHLLIGGNSMVGNVIQKRAGHIAMDVDAEELHFKNPHLPRTHSEMALPLIAGDDLIGALTVQSEQEAAFTESDMSALQTMADQLAVAIQNARLHQQNKELLRQAERRAKLLKAANTVGKEVTSILSLDDLLPKMVNTIVATYNFYYAGAFLVDPSGEWAVLRAGYGAAGAAMLAEGHKLEVHGNSMIGDCIRSNQARIASKVDSERIHFKNPHLPSTRAEMALPLAFDGKVLGAVTVQSADERAFSQDDITTLQTMADHLAVAIQNAYSLEALKQAHAELIRTKVYEALTVATTEAIHWIGNKALPITVTIDRLEQEIAEDQLDLASLREDLDLISESASLIVAVKEQLIGQAREQKPSPVMIADVLRAAALDRGIQLSRINLTSASEAAYVIADSTQLARALGNLLCNAVEAGANNLDVRVFPGINKGETIIEIADDGEGMSPEVLQKIWSPFYTTRGLSHSGLGMPAALHVITQLQGQISVESQIGKGTTVHIVLPSAEQPTLILPADLGPIQLIDDDDPWASMFAQAVGDGLIRSQTPDPTASLILIDEHLECVNLDDVLAQITEANLASKTVLVTAALHVDRLTRHLALVRDVVIKPYTTEEIKKLLK